MSASARVESGKGVAAAHSGNTFFKGRLCAHDQAWVWANLSAALLQDFFWKAPWCASPNFGGRIAIVTPWLGYRFERPAFETRTKLPKRHQSPFRKQNTSRRVEELSWSSNLRNVVTIQTNHASKRTRIYIKSSIRGGQKWPRFAGYSSGVMLGVAFRSAIFSSNACSDLSNLFGSLSEQNSRTEEALRKCCAQCLLDFAKLTQHECRQYIQGRLAPHSQRPFSLIEIALTMQFHNEANRPTHNCCQAKGLRANEHSRAFITFTCPSAMLILFFSLRWLSHAASLSTGHILFNNGSDVLSACIGCGQLHRTRLHEGRNFPAAPIQPRPKFLCVGGIVIASARVRSFVRS